MPVMSVVVFGVLFLTLSAGIWVGFSLFIVGFVGMTLFSSLPAGNNMASSVWATVEKWEYVALPCSFSWGRSSTVRAFPNGCSGPWCPGSTGCPAACC
jgi:C4-dicarboxylate transporter DctM subunit